MNDLVEILVVEDSLTQALRLRQILEAEGYRVALARNGAEGLLALRSQRPALVITDVNMPEMDGYELCRRIKADETLRELPVVLLTTLSDPEDIVRGLDCGADNFLTKPYEKDHLLSRIRHILLNGQLRQSSHAEVGVEVIFAGHKRFLTSERIQILDMLLASFETAVTKTRQLEEANNELRSALETIEALKAGYLTLLESNPDGMVVVDRGGSVRYANPAARTLMGGGEVEGSRSIFHLDLDNTHQLSFPQDGGEARVVEQRTAPTTWEDDAAYLVSLRDITALVRMQEEIRALSLSDELTGLYNRRAFVTLAGQQMKLADRNGEVVSLLFVDLDNMKTINDTLGHKAGDLALVETARILREVCREADIVARIGGDEFVVFQMDSSEEEAGTVRERIQLHLEAWERGERRPYRLAMSIGVASRRPGEAVSLEELLHWADRRMYEAKLVRKQSGQ